MKSLNFRSTALSLLTLVATSAATAAPSITFDGAAMHSAQDINSYTTYEVKSPLIASAGAATAVAEHLFELSGQATSVELKKSPKGRFGYINQDDRSASFYYSPATGDITFSRGMQDYTGEMNTPGLPERAEAIELAKDYLANLGLLPEHGSEMVVNEVGSLNMSVAREDGTTSDYRKQVSVYFSRQINGVDVVGTGSKMIVHLGTHGELAGLIRRWSEVEATQAAPAAFIPTSQVRARMAAQLDKDWREASEIVAEAPRMVIYDDGHGVLEPAYVTDSKVYHDKPNAPRMEDQSRSAISALKVGRAWYAQQEKAQAQPQRAEQ